MTLRVSMCPRDKRFVRYEHVAGDGQSDRVTYAPAYGRSRLVLIQETIARRHTWRTLFWLSIGFLIGVIASF